MSTVLLKIQDESATGKILNEISIALKNELCTVRDIVEARVFSEVENYNKKLPEFYNGLVAPLDSEKSLNGYKLKTKRLLDPEKQFYIALDAFKKNGYFVLIDNKQAETLEEEVLVTKNTIVSFVKLTPLVGG
jgi:hypothetical protein